jgi:hypothetical protein
MRHVGIHLRDDAVPMAGSPLEPRSVRRAEASFAGSRQQMDATTELRVGTHDTARPVRTVVIHHQDIRVHGSDNAIDDARDRVGLVVGRNDDDGPHDSSFGHVLVVVSGPMVPDPRSMAIRREGVQLPVAKSADQPETESCLTNRPRSTLVVLEQCEVGDSS